MQLITYTANNRLNPKLIPELLKNLGGKASDVMLNQASTQNQILLAT